MKIVTWLDLLDVEHEQRVVFNELPKEVRFRGSMKWIKIFLKNTVMI
jgi:hypothetical protein